MKKIGMRTIKTGIAVTLSVILAQLGIVQNLTLTASASIMSMKSTVRRSLESGIARLLGTLLGGILGYLFSVAFNGSYWYAGIGVVLTIHLCHMFKFSSGVVVSALTFISILIGVTGNDPLAYSIGRTVDTAIGVLISLCINYWVSRKKYINMLYSEFLFTETKFLELSREISRDRKFYMHNELQDELEKLNNYYDQLVDELHYFREGADLETLKISIDLCTQIFYHLYGMYTLTQDITIELDAETSDAIRMYHKKCINKLLYEVKTESNSRDDEVF